MDLKDMDLINSFFLQFLHTILNTYHIFLSNNVNLQDSCNRHKDLDTTMVYYLLYNIPVNIFLEEQNILIRRQKNQNIKLQSYFIIGRATLSQISSTCVRQQLISWTLVEGPIEIGLRSFNSLWISLAFGSIHCSFLRIVTDSEIPWPKEIVGRE